MTSKTSPTTPAGSVDSEVAIRELIAQSKSRTALEKAKEFHKAHNTPASEALLLDCYIARVQALADQKMVPEATALVDLVKHRFPAAGQKIEILLHAASAHGGGGDLAQLLHPLNDAGLPTGSRAAIELSVQNQVTDLAALASCTALPAEHGLRQAAHALDRALALVTSGPVTDDQIALLEVSHRSPLAPWKVLIRAIASWYREDDDACRQYLKTLKPESAAARVTPVLTAMLGDKPARPLKPAETALVAATVESADALRSALEKLDTALRGRGPGILPALFKSMRTVVRECQRSAPYLQSRLKQILAVRGYVFGLDPDRVAASLEGEVPEDAEYFRMVACGMHTYDEPDALVLAFENWDLFRRKAVEEKWFPAVGVEVATLLLHMADELAQIPAPILKKMQKSSGKKSDCYYLYPDKLYRMACDMDSRPEAFAKWLSWAYRQSLSAAENVAKHWNKVRQSDLEPLLFLMKEAEKRSALPSALGYLDKAARIDPIHLEVRSARPRLLANSIIRHINQGKPHLAAQKLTTFASLPQADQGYRPAFSGAISYVLHLISGQQTLAAESLGSLEKQVDGSKIAAQIVLWGLTSRAKNMPRIDAFRVEQLSVAERQELPKGLAIVASITSDLGIKKTQYPGTYFIEAEKQFPHASASLSVEQLRRLGTFVVDCDRDQFAWAVSTAGLKRGGSTEPAFLWMRACAVPIAHAKRGLALAAATVQLCRFYGETSLVDRALKRAQVPFSDEPVTLTLDQAREVVKRELAQPTFPTVRSKPMYGDMLPASECDCPSCRRGRGQRTGPFNEFDFLGDDEDDDDDFLDPPRTGASEAELIKIFRQSAPKEFPPAMIDELVEMLKTEFRAGVSPQEILDGMAAVMGIASKAKQKGGRKQ